MKKFFGLLLVSLPFAAMAAGIWATEGPAAIAIIFGGVATVVLVLLGGIALLLS